MYITIIHTEVLPGFQAEMIPRSTKMKCVKILKYLQWMSKQGHENHELYSAQIITK